MDGRTYSSDAVFCNAICQFFVGFSGPVFRSGTRGSSEHGLRRAGTIRFADPSCRNRFLRNRRLFTCKWRSVPFLAIPLALWARRSKTQIGMLAIASAVLLASYFHGYVSPTQHSDPRLILWQPNLLVYIDLELGNPFGQFFRELSNRYFLWWDGLFGAFGLAYFVAAALRHLRQDRPANGGLELTFSVLLDL